MTKNIDPDALTPTIDFTAEFTGDQFTITMEPLPAHCDGCATDYAWDLIGLGLQRTNFMLIEVRPLGKHLWTLTYMDDKPTTTVTITVLAATGPDAVTEAEARFPLAPEGMSLRITGE